MSGITVFLADDHAVLRDGLRMLLEASPDIRVVGEAADGSEAVRQVEKLRPDIVIMDIAMPEMNGIAATRQIREACPSVQVIILSMHSTDEHVFRALEAGARGFVLKEAAGSEVVRAVHVVFDGHRYLSQKIEDSVVDNYVEQRRSGELENPLIRLTLRELEVLQLVVEGHSNATIADTLSLSPKTVGTYRSRLMQKLGINNLPDLVRFAIQHDLIPPE
jgi:DNA-binding NarL/FixJ family response regulator